eukprot:9222519-Ditylum_brightwellii.AAC.1
MVESRQRGLNKNAEDNMEFKLWCQSYTNKDSKTTSNNLDLQTKLQLPNTLFSSLSSDQKKAFLKWKNATANGERVSNEEILEILRQEETSCDRKQKRKGKRKKSRAMKVRLTGAQTSETKSEEVCLIMKLDKEDTSSVSASSLEDTRKVRANKVVRINRSESNLGDSDEFFHNTILDSSTEWTILGGPAWSIIKKFKHSLNMSAVGNTMSVMAMQLCDAVTAILNGNGQ